MSAGAGPGVLAVDVGTSGVRAAVVSAAGTVVTSSYRPALPTSPMVNFVEFDPVDQAGEIGRAHV